jgi:hypothetical protein
MKLYRQKKTPDSYNIARWISLQQSSSDKQGEMAKEMMNLALRSIFVHTSQSILYIVKLYDMVPPALLTLRRKACCGFECP